MLDKKGQITVFIILGILILVLIATGIYFVRIPVVEDEVKQALGTDSVSDVVNECFDDTAKQAMIKVGEAGGKINSDSYFTNLVYKINFGITNESITFPTYEEVANELEDYVEMQFYECINSSFDETLSDYLNFGAPSANVELTDYSVIFNLEPDLVFTKDQETKVFQEYSEVYDVRLKWILNVSNSILEQAANNKIVPFSSTKFIDPYLDVNVQSISEDVVIYELTDNNSRIEGFPYLLRFAIDLSSNANSENQIPIIKEIPQFEINEGDLFYYQIKADDPEGKIITFDAVSSLFDISADGEVSFTAAKGSAGNYSIPIFAEDEDGGIATVFLEIEIDE